VSTAHDCETESPLLFRFDQGSIRRSSSWLGLPLDAAEFFCVCEYEVHVLIECEHLSRHLSAVGQGNPHPIVDEILHLALLVGGHVGWAMRTDATWE
jgi:hypothetical protein